MAKLYHLYMPRQAGKTAASEAERAAVDKRNKVKRAALETNS